MLMIFCVLMCVTTPVLLILTRTKPHEKRVQQRIDSLISLKGSAEDEDEDDLGLKKKAPGGLSGRITQRVRDYAAAQKLEKKLIHAGWNISVGKFLVIMASSAVGSGLVVHVFVDQLPVMGIAMVAGGGAVFGLLKFKIGRRLKKFNEGLADSIDLMSRALKAGHAMSSAIEVVAEQAPEPIGSEFARCAQQQRFGIPFRESMLEFTDRVPSQDMYFLVTAILVQKETGGDLTEILDRTTEVIRERVRIAGEVKTHTAQGRLTGWILSGLPIALLGIVSVMSPHYAEPLFHDPMGQKLLYAAGGLIAMGSFVIQKIVDIKV